MNEIRRICVVCYAEIYNGGSLYCSKTCSRRAKRARKSGSDRYAIGTFCPACGEKKLLVDSPIGAVCSECAPFRSCDKLAYRSRVAAEWAITVYALRAIDEPEFKPQRAYWCPLCNYYHLTTKRVKVKEQ